MKIIGEEFRRATARVGLIALGSALLSAVLVAPAQASTATEVAPAADRGKKHHKPVVFGHRGASGYRPEHTLAAYELAIEQGADFIEPDVVSTKDGVLVARHENEISGTTDVADHPEFADRRTTKTIDGKAITGWFTEDFTIDELKTLRATERIPDVRPGNTAYDGKFEVPTLEEVLRLARRHRVGVAPETKHPTYFQDIGLAMERPLVDTLRRSGLDRGAKGRGGTRVILQSFETENLKELSRMTKVPLMQLTSASGAPYDQVAAGTGVTYADVMSPEGLKKVRKYADYLGPAKDSVIPLRTDGTLGEPTSLVKDAKRAGLKVVPYTFRAENRYLPVDYRSGADLNAFGDLAGELHAYADAGVYGLFSDHPDLAVQAFGR